uniref:Transmembrane protein n=1 Tax=Chromera velia CCMP2878 TaxID=1169474 RepID=A0A0G4HSG1_9ALVE|eukprot:Cvel_8259.t1-p1 / transcript=Cvel_8259.t1 / gene=Cvel_8259 / organism=Chromera_velia_CCMP2878 / gene_product=hypothetical protein / transcript_product=hypothetical protein / location=Cvel_scaffold452:37123-38739(+) / protein_length=437 / sequence_SO=supercontig / SO=protein_coding / is_pseudo=false
MFFAPLDLEGSLVSIGGTEVERSGGGGATEDMGGTGDDNKETSGGDGEGEEENKEEETETGDGGQNGRDGTPGPATEGHLPSSSSSSHRGAFTSAFLFFVLTAGCGCGCCMGIGALRVFEKQKKMDEERERALESGDALPTVHALPFGTVTAAEAGNGTSMRSQPQVREARDGDKSVVKSIVTKAKKAAGTVARKVGEKTSSLSGRGGVMPSVKGKGRGGGKKKGKTFYIELNEEGDATSSRPSMGLEGGHLPQSRGSREDPFALDTDGLPVPRGHMERGGGESGDHVSSGIGRGVLYVEGGGGEGGYNVQHQGVAEQKRRKKGKFSRKGYGRVGEGRGREEEEEEDGEEGGESGSSDDGRKAQAQALRGRPNSGQSSGGHGMVGMRGGVGEIEDEDGEEEEEEEDIDLDSSGSEEERESPDRSQRGNPNAYAANLL